MHADCKLSLVFDDDALMLVAIDNFSPRICENELVLRKEVSTFLYKGLYIS